MQAARHLCRKFRFLYNVLLQAFKLKNSTIFIGHTISSQEVDRSVNGENIPLIACENGKLEMVNGLSVEMAYVKHIPRHWIGRCDVFVLISAKKFQAGEGHPITNTTSESKTTTIYIATIRVMSYLCGYENQSRC
jgi:hypothetical protein